MLTWLVRVLEMIRFSHTIFAMPFALLAAVMAWHVNASERQFPAEHSALQKLIASIRWQELLAIVLCMVTARSAAMAFNRIVDRRIDAQNPRTSQRHLPAGLLSVAGVALFTILSSLAFVASTLLLLPNRWPLILSVPVLLFLMAYSFTKRFTAWAHGWLGTSLMLAPISTWIALRGEQVWAHPSDILPSLILGIAVLCWVSGFDIIYACLDVEFDKQYGLHSAPSRLGVPAALRVAAFCHLGMILSLACLPWVPMWTGQSLDLTWIYGTGVSMVAILLIYEHALVRPGDLGRVNVAFFHINSVVSMGVFGFVTLDLVT